MSQHVVRRDNVRIAYERRGQGPIVVLVQGLGLSGEMWLRLPGGLVKSGHTVLLPDNRGSGRSDAPPPPYSMAEMADDLAAVMADAGGEPAIVVGLSLGGMVAQQLALRRPELVRGLVLASTTCGLPLGRPPRLEFLWLLARSLTGSERAALHLRQKLVHPKSLERNPDLFDEWDLVVERQRFSWKGLLGQLAAAASHSTCFSLHRIRCPVELIAGDSDAIIPADNSRILARRLPDPLLTILAEAGHAFPLEYPWSLPRAIRRLEERLG